MAIYMKIDGIDGNVSTKGYEKWIELDSVSHDITRSINTQPGKVADRETTRPMIGEILITKKMDQTAPHLFTEACVGKAQSKPVQIHFVQTGEDISPFMEYSLQNVLISQYSVNHDKMGKDPVEAVKLNFDKIEVKYTPYDAAHKPQSPIPAGYDLATAKKV